MWNMLDYLTECGWTVALCEAGIASSGVADGLLNASHFTKTRHAHQITLQHCTNCREKHMPYPMSHRQALLKSGD